MDLLSFGIIGCLPFPLQKIREILYSLISSSSMKQIALWNYEIQLSYDIKHPTHGAQSVKKINVSGFSEGICKNTRISGGFRVAISLLMGRSTQKFQIILWKSVDLSNFGTVSNSFLTTNFCILCSPNFLCIGAIDPKKHLGFYSRIKLTIP